jgi:hypothetical protein
MVNGLIGRTARMVVTGLVGVAAYDGVKRIARSGAVRNATVAGTAWGLRGIRAAEAGAERTRLVTGDIVSEARARIGEEAPPPGPTNGHGHGHEH